MRRLIALVLLAALAGVAYATASGGSVRTSQRTYYVSVDGTSPSYVAADSSGRGNKRAAVIAAVVSGQAVKALLRIQEAKGSVFVDVIFSDTLANLTTVIGSMDLSAAHPSHPQPADDTVDASAITNGG